MFLRNLKFEDAPTVLPKSSDARLVRNAERPSAFHQRLLRYGAVYMRYDIVGARSPDDLIGPIVVSSRGAHVAQKGADDN